MAERTQTRGRFTYVPALDGLRAIAVLLVVLIHVTGTFAPKWRERIVPGGFIGVDIFFVLSGFLITTLLLQEHRGANRIRIGNFYRATALRLLPVLFVFVAVHTVYTYAIGINGHNERSALLSVVFYYSNWSSITTVLTMPAGLAHVWSLAVEEQFYLVWPLVLLVILRLRLRVPATLALFALLVAAVDINRIVQFRHGPSWRYVLLYGRTDTRADSLLIGALLAFLSAHGLARRSLGIAPWIAAAFLAVCAMTVHTPSPFLYWGGFTLIAVAAAVVILATVQGSWGGTAFLALPPLRAIGLVSYGVYLWHPLVFAGVQHFGPDWPLAGKIVVGLGVTAAVTWLSWVVVEKPALRWKDRLARTTRDSAARSEVESSDPAVGHGLA